MLHKNGINIMTHTILDGKLLFGQVSSYNCSNDKTGTPCNINGYDLPPDSPPPGVTPCEPNNYYLFKSCAKFKVREFLFVEEMSAGKIDWLLVLGSPVPRLEKD